jgi:hypothetical protein
VKSAASIVLSAGRPVIWIFRGFGWALKGPAMLAGLLLEILGRIFEYSLGRMF